MKDRGVVLGLGLVLFVAHLIEEQLTGFAHADQSTVQLAALVGLDAASTALVTGLLVVTLLGWLLARARRGASDVRDDVVLLTILLVEGSHVIDVARVSEYTSGAVTGTLLALPGIWYLFRVSSWRLVVYTLGLTAIVFVYAALLSIVDTWLGLSSFQSPAVTFVGLILVLGGFVIRVLAHTEFLRGQVKILALMAQRTLLTSGLFAFSRNPLYVGLVVMQLGAGLMVGSWSTLVFVVAELVMWQLWLLRGEEPSLQRAFGEEFTRYAKRVPRWL